MEPDQRDRIKTGGRTLLLTDSIRKKNRIMPDHRTAYDHNLTSL